MTTLLGFFLSFLVSCGVTLALVRAGRSRFLAREPTEDRWHRSATPSMGGIGIYAGFLVSTLAFSTFVPKVWAILLGSSLIFGAGLIDDFRPLPAYAKMAIQITLSAILVGLNFHAMLAGNPYVYIGVTVFWIVFMSNAFNLLDNMDGLSSGVALIAIFFMAAIDRVSAGTLPLPMLAALAGSILGFFVFNFPPAKIFMGDCGSQFIGFTLACLSILDSWQNTTNLFFMLIPPVLIFAVPIFDTTLVTILRKYYGRPISQGGRDHASHRLVGLGLSERSTVFLLWGISALFGVVAVLTRIFDFETWGILIAAMMAALLVFGILLAQERKVSKDAATFPVPGSAFAPINFFFQRRLVEVLIDTLLIAMAYCGAYLLRFDWTLDAYHARQLASTLPLVLGTKILLMLLLGLYKGFWIYIDFETVIRYTKILFLSSALSIAMISFFFRFTGFSRTIFAIDFLLLLIFVIGSRALLRWAREIFFAYPVSGVPILVVGTKPHTKQLLVEIRRHREWNLRPLAVLDPDPRMDNLREADVPVFASIAGLTQDWKKRIAHVVLLEEDLGDDLIREMRAYCENEKFPLTVLESLQKTLVARIHTGGRHGG